MDVWGGGGKRTGRFQNFCFIDIFPENYLQRNFILQLSFAVYILSVQELFDNSDISCPPLEHGHGKHVADDFMGI